MKNPTESIEKRLAQFKGTLPSGIKTLDVPRAAEAGIVLHKSCLGSVLCEPNAMCSSLHLAKGMFAFIGRHSYVNQGGYLRRGVFIGRYCSIGQRVSLGAAMHAMHGVSTSPSLGGGGSQPYTEEQQIRLFGRVRQGRRATTIIENDVWIGDGATVLTGVRIATGAVVAANAVVVKDVGPYEIVRGSPATVVRTRFPQDVCTGLLASEWWNRPHTQLKALPLGNVLAFLDALACQQPVAGDDPVRLVAAQARS